MSPELLLSRTTRQPYDPGKLCALRGTRQCSTAHMRRQCMHRGSTCGLIACREHLACNAAAVPAFPAPPHSCQVQQPARPPHPALPAAAQVDVWACGVWLVALLSGVFPFAPLPGTSAKEAQDQLL